ncbi:TetR/AcrR family transcriptional regulator [Ursidibacter maritimus]|uniref:TetR/AcrR family transcriptional regulator n=2 Tax=Ursidibacter maritimus TaxID=1331689 RepID=A0A949T739_9PAST|nr:TetR/AcrR family transcriptional regulator [Ursidibacter maritimus]KAE9542095.1 hypothetical protein A1D26_07905 [Ursidibacter maritimus]MBV6523677.1 TetR/AcrR family transcriptional regulator [Ursidibacter maritimus]MBV6525217.1 TetR/AcrR family transcriptional regulator [Ursidibacter maritimus]MBV6527547.1 TetR/AcrR family transcriptional regulator [Ursidibacter maritimus]MBV6530226.1 TetR/AcrR family transcriptional regulator [Ursidibacter maritimus]
MKKIDKLKLIAEQLFSAQGLKRVSIDEICQQSKVSRVTFYKHFKNKKALIKELFTEQKNTTRQAFLQLLEQQASLEEIIETIFSLQKKALDGLYSQAILSDLHSLDLELTMFFREMEQEKHDFMHYFFTQLQEKDIIARDIPIVLIDMLIKALDIFSRKKEITNHYIGNEQQLFQDLLRIFIYGISSQTKNNKQ